MAADEIRVGLRQRNAASLVGSFYPSDMPEDWRPDYLASMTSAVWITPADADAMAMLAAVADSPRPMTALLDGAESDWPEAVRNWLGEHPDRALLREPERAGEPAHCLWHPHGTERGCAIGLVAASDQPAQLRGWIEAFAEQAPAGVALLFVEGERPSTATLDRLQALLELMGW